MVQLYISGSRIAYAEKELKAFQKISVASGNTAVVKLQLVVSDLAYYNETVKKWMVEPGEYTLSVGNSSRNISQRHLSG